MFDFFNMAYNYEARAIARFEQGDVIIDTCAVIDAAQPYETGVSHPAYNDGDWVIVELYDTKEEAQTGHDKWVETMTAAELPESLCDVSSASITQLLDTSTGNDWRTYKINEPVALEEEES